MIVATFISLLVAAFSGYSELIMLFLVLLIGLWLIGE